MKLTVSIFLVLFVLPSFSQILKVEISGIRSDKGVIQLSVYRDSETFTAETPFRTCNVEKTVMIDGCLTTTISDLEPGNLGIAIIDDKNRNGKMDYRFFVPIEGFGFSNYYFKGTCKPVFEDFGFQFSDEDMSISIKVQYF